MDIKKKRTELLKASENAINELIKVPLSKRILFENLQNCTVNVEYYDGDLQFNVTENTYLVYPTDSTIDENGYIILDKIKSNC